MSNLSDEKRGQLKIVVILFLIAFIVSYGVYIYFKYFSNSKMSHKSTEDAQVIFTQPILQFFNFKTTLNEYPDRIKIHYPYLVIVRPDKFQSEIYNIQTKRKERTVNQVLLDYFNGNSIYNKQGYETYYNNIGLGLLCDQAFIKSTTEILCITRPDQNISNNKLISINTQTLDQTGVYKSQNILTAIYFDKGTTYLGEYNLDSKKAYIIANHKITSIEDFVNIIYPLGGNFYAASFKSLRNNHVESYSKINMPNNKITTSLIAKNKIVFY